MIIFCNLQKNIYMIQVRMGYNYIISLILIIVIMMVIYEYVIEKKELFSFITPPNLKDGDKFMLKTLDGQYVSICNNCSPYDANIKNLCSSLVCLTRYPLKSGVFTYHRFRDGRFGIETYEFKYWKHCDTCVHDCRGSICADGINKNLKTHKWFLIKNADQYNSISIKSNNGRMIQRCDCSQDCGKILCTMGLGGNEKFIVEKIDSGPVEPQELMYKPRRYKSEIFNGVSLSMLQ